MKVTLAGYNIDIETIEAARQAVSVHLMTPETLSAAYARISRSPKTAGELRSEARENVEKARKSNRNIVFEMGHASIAEHAVFNIDLEGMSRFLLEEIQRHRLASYTEKSQRYVKLGDDFLYPEEWSDLESELKELHDRCSEFYQKLCKADVPGEDARYFLPFTTKTQLGMTINARSAEHLILALASSTLEESHLLATKLHEICGEVTPSLIRYIVPSEYHRRMYSSGITPVITDKNQDFSMYSEFSGGYIRLVNMTENPDNTILTANYARNAGLGFDDARDYIDSLSIDEKGAYFSGLTESATIHDRMTVDFEHVVMTWDIVLSAAAFAQLKRHRISSIGHSFLDPNLGFTIPQSISTDFYSECKKIISYSESIYNLFIEKNGPVAAAAYSLLSGHRRRVIWTLNLREYYHFSRLRQDAHAQWDIRNMANAMTEKLRDMIPVCSQFLGGKSELSSDLEY